MSVHLVHDQRGKKTALAAMELKVQAAVSFHVVQEAKPL